MEMGMVNQAWYQFEQWVDEDVKILPPHEKEARKCITVTKDKLEEAAREKNETEKTINIEIREKMERYGCSNLSSSENLWKMQEDKN
jgi:hypothetical protein